MADSMSQEEIQEALGKIPIADLLLQTVYTVSQLTYLRLSSKPPDLAQARLGIDALVALVPVLELPPDARRDLEQMVTNLKLGFAAAAAPGPAAEEPPAPEPPAEEPDAGS